MILKDYIAIFPKNVIGMLMKMLRENMNESVANYIQENGLYHFTTGLDTAKLIKESGYIKESSKIESYGNSVTHFFSGIPDIETYNKNLGYGGYDNLLINPEKILYAIKLNINKEQLSNYKIRVQDGVILHEGRCILKDDQVEIKQMVLDLIEDKDGQKRLGFREITEQELAKNRDSVVCINGIQMPIPRTINRYKPSEECLRAIKEERKRLGLSNIMFLDDITIFQYIAKIEGRKSSETIKLILEKFKKNIKNIMKPKIKAIDENPNKKIKRILQDIQYGSIDTRRPVRDKKYTNLIISLNKQGKPQRNSSEIMESLQNNNYYQYIGAKEQALGKSKIPNSKIHEINHSRRVVILESIILEELGVNFDKRIADIMITAEYNHDIGRILYVEPHVKRNVKMLRNMDLRHVDGREYSEDDRKLLYFLVEGHKIPNKKIDKLLDKYGIEEEKRSEYKLYLDVMKDANSLDRARLSSKNSMNLNPKLLRLEFSKRLIDFSFDLEKLSTIVKDNSIMFYEIEKQNNFIEELRKHAEEKPKEQKNARNVKIIKDRDRKNAIDPNR